MKRSLFLALASFGLSSLAPAATFTWQPNPSDMGDLDHHLAYTWKITGISIPTVADISSATLFFKNIANWDNNPNRLFLHLLDTSINLVNNVPVSVASFTDSPNDTGMYDDFAGWRYDSNPLVTHTGGSEPANTYLYTYQNLTTSPQDKTYTFTGAQLDALKLYIGAGGDIAFGMDPDCHYFNDGVTFTINTRDSRGGTEAPEPGSVMLLGTVVAGVLYRLRKRSVAA